MNANTIRLLLIITLFLIVSRMDYEDQFKPLSGGYTHVGR